MNSRLFNSSYLPFSSFIGNEELKIALILNAVDPKIGGVLVQGHKGTGKSSIIRAFEKILPPNYCIDGNCPYSCSPEECCPSCQQLLTDSAPLEKRSKKILTLPLSVTEDRLIGTLDLEKTLKTGEVTFYPGLLAQANNNVFYIDEVNLLSEPVVNIILSTIGTAMNVVERDDISFRHPVNCLLIGSMNEEEGILRPHFAERFGLSVNIKTNSSVIARRQIIKLNVFPSAKEQAMAEKRDQELRNQIIAAQERLAKIEKGDQIKHLIVRLCGVLKVDGSRPDITIFRAARAMAALDGLNEIKGKHVYEAARLALFHRTRGQGDLPPVTEEELAAVFQRIVQELEEEENFLDDEFLTEIRVSQTKLKILVGKKMKTWKVISTVGFLLLILFFAFILSPFTEILTILGFALLAAVGLGLAIMVLPMLIELRNLLAEKIEKHSESRLVRFIRAGSLVGIPGLLAVVFKAVEPLSPTMQFFLLSSAILISLSILMVLFSRETSLEKETMRSKRRTSRFVLLLRVGGLAIVVFSFLVFSTPQAQFQLLFLILGVFVFLSSYIFPLKPPQEEQVKENDSEKLIGQVDETEEEKEEPKKLPFEDQQEQKSTYFKTTTRWPKFLENPIVAIVALIALPTLSFYIIAEYWLGIPLNPILIIPFFLVYVFFLLLITRAGGKRGQPVPLPWEDQGTIYSSEFEEPAYENFPKAQEMKSSILELDIPDGPANLEAEDAPPILINEWNRLAGSSLISYIPDEFRVGHPLFSPQSEVSLPASSIFIEGGSPLRSKVQDMGKRAKASANLAKGKVISWQPAKQHYHNLHLPATIRKAAKHPPKNSNLALNILKSDLCEKKFSYKTKAAIIFVIDLSRSMEPIIESIADSITALHKDAIAHRDRVGIIGCKHLETILAQSPTTNLFLVQKALRSLGVSGLTPLAGGVLLAIQILRNETRRDPNIIPVMVILSDGGTNVPLSFNLQTGKQRNLSKYTLWNGDGIPEAVQDLLNTGWLLRQEGIKCLIVAPPSVRYDPSSAHGEKTLYHFRRITQGRIYRPREIGIELMKRLNKVIHSS
ncbi:MAG: VWA domain-containing protein [Candidatus Hodarchaeota archaeon]